MVAPSPSTSEATSPGSVNVICSMKLSENAGSMASLRAVVTWTAKLPEAPASWSASIFLPSSS